MGIYTIIDMHGVVGRETRNANWLLKSCSLRKAATGTGGMAPNIILPTTVNSMNFIASIFRMFIRLWRNATRLSRPAHRRRGERPAVLPQTSYIHPRISGDMVRYFEWMGAAVHTADHRAGAMHGKQFLVDCVHTGIDENFVYGRLDFVGKPPEVDFDLVVNLESRATDEQRPRRALRFDARVQAGKSRSWQVSSQEEQTPIASSQNPGDDVKVALLRNFEFKIPLAWLLAKPTASVPVGTGGKATTPVATLLRLRFSVWQNRLPVDALPLEGWIELRLLSEEDLMALAF